MIVSFSKVRSLCTTDCDRSGIFFRPSSDGGCELCSASSVITASEDDSATIESALSKRITVAVEVIQTVADGSRSKEDSGECINDDLTKQQSASRSNLGTKKDDATSLTAELFQLLLSTYLSSLSNHHQYHHHVDKALPTFLLEQDGQMAALSLLPFLCEECNAEDLIGRGTCVLSMIQRILYYSSNSGDYNDGSERMMEIVSDQKEALQSTASLCLSLLVVILELGSQQRSADQEILLKSFLPVLKNIEMNI